jgi:putative NADH-flavin reductase
MEAIVGESDLAWTIVRPSELTDDEGTGDYRTKVGYSFPESSTTTRDDLAEFIVEELEANQFLREGVAIVTV